MIRPSILPDPAPAVPHCLATPPCPSRPGRRPARVRRAAAYLALATCIGLAGCAVGPDYVRPAVDTGLAYKEAAGQAVVPGWKPAQPANADAASAWWRVYDDPELDSLMARLNEANLDIAQAEANYRQAQALVRGARSALYPNVGVSGGVSRAGAGSGDSGTGSRVNNTYSLTGSVSWEVDLWGSVRRNIEASRAGAQASAADLAAARLSAQSALAQNYFQLRVLDEHARLLTETVAAYQRSLQLTTNRYEVGVAPKSDVSVALTQVENTRASLIDLQWQRGQLEHAIAVQIGTTPAAFSLPPQPFALRIPEIPLGLPSQLLERRPDVAGAERRTAQANAQIGIAQAAWFPDLTLSADGGFRSGQFAQWLTAPARFWSLGPILAQTIFDGGLRDAQIASARAGYDAQVAGYRQVVLGALREVEDYLIQLRVMADEQAVQRRALQAARESLQLTRNQYEAGLVDFLDVAQLQAAALNTERTAISLLGDRLTASVRLITALGGGWDGNLDAVARGNANTNTETAVPAPVDASGAAVRAPATEARQ